MNPRIRHLRAIRGDMSTGRKDLADLRLSLGVIGAHIAGMRRDLSMLHGDIANAHTRLDHHEECLAGIGRRLM